MQRLSIHALLIKKLHIYGFNEKLIHWIESFLSSCTQRVVIDGASSIFALVLSGVPQGSVLGPLLFILFVNDMALRVKNSTVWLFADNTCLLRVIETLANVDELQEDLDEVIRWSKSNNMLLHEEKFEYVCHSYARNLVWKGMPFSAEFFIYNLSDSTLLTPTETVKDLGVIVISDLSWSIQISAMASKGRAMSACNIFWTCCQINLFTLGYRVNVARTFFRKFLCLDPPVPRPKFELF